MVSSRVSLTSWGGSTAIALVGDPYNDGVTIKMLYGVDLYINQLCTPSFPIGLVKTESGFIVRLVETGLERLTLVLTMISVDANPLLVFSDLMCHLVDTGISASWFHCAI